MTLGFWAHTHSTLVLWKAVNSGLWEDPVPLLLEEGLMRLSARFMKPHHGLQWRRSDSADSGPLLGKEERPTSLPAARDDSGSWDEWGGGVEEVGAGKNDPMSRWSSSLHRWKKIPKSRLLGLSGGRIATAALLLIALFLPLSILWSCNEGTGDPNTPPPSLAY